MLVSYVLGDRPVCFLRSNKALCKKIKHNGEGYSCFITKRMNRSKIPWMSALKSIECVT